MGPYLTTPKKEKDIENGENGKVITLPSENILDPFRSMRDAGLEKYNGRFTYRISRFTRRGSSLRSIRWARR